jgi:hypothetical protein
VVLGRQIIGETARALVVVALLFLSFGQHPEPRHGQVGASAAVNAYLAATASLSDLCSDGDHGGPGHAPCHACRAEMAMPPPAPCAVEPAYAAAVAIAYADRPQFHAVTRAWGAAPPRGPPLV